MSEWIAAMIDDWTRYAPAANFVLLVLVIILVALLHWDSHRPHE